MRHGTGDGSSWKNDLYDSGTEIACAMRENRVVTPDCYCNAEYLIVTGTTQQQNFVTVISSSVYNCILPHRTIFSRPSHRFATTFVIAILDDV